MMHDENNDTSSLADIIGEPIHTYTRAQALEDGILEDVIVVASSRGGHS